MNNKRPLAERIDNWLERLEHRIASSMYQDKSTLRRVGHCAFCGEWCKGTIKDGFVHNDGEAACKNIDHYAVPRQVFLEEAGRQAQAQIDRLKNQQEN